MGQSNLNKAKVAKKDEFYTQLADIENELRHYKNHFRGKTVLCNCDDPRVRMGYAASVASTSPLSRWWPNRGRQLPDALP